MSTRREPEPRADDANCPRVGWVAGCDCRHCSGRCLCTPLPDGFERYGRAAARTASQLGR